MGVCMISNIKVILLYLLYKGDTERREVYCQFLVNLILSPFQYFGCQWYDKMYLIIVYSIMIYIKNLKATVNILFYLVRIFE